jgi:hypothetical protein
MLDLTAASGAAGMVWVIYVASLLITGLLVISFRGAVQF